MARRKRTNDQPIGVGLTTRQTKRKKALGNEYLLDFFPVLTMIRQIFTRFLIRIW